jgi:stage II sporulation protein AA (anti-sigma F factor antagonist)
MPDLVCHLIPVKANPSLAVVSLRGSIDPRNLSGLAAALQTATGRGFRTLVFDLGEIRYINSAGLAYLVNLSDLLESRGGGLHLANAQPKVKLVFELMGLTEFFTIHKSVGSVLALLGKERRATAAAAPPRPARRPG